MYDDPDHSVEYDIVEVTNAMLIVGLWQRLIVHTGTLRIFQCLAKGTSKHSKDYCYL